MNPFLVIAVAAAFLCLCIAARRDRLDADRLDRRLRELAE